MVEGVKSEFGVMAPGAPADESLIGVHAWPGAVSSYRLSGTEQQPVLALTLSPRPDSGLPGPADSVQQAALLAAQQAERYRLIRAQLDDPSLTVSVLTTLDESLVLPAADGPSSLRRFASSAQLFCQAAATATAPKLAGLATLDELLDRYGLSPEQLAAVNADRPLNGLLAAGQPLARRLGQAAPDTVPVEASTLAEVAAGLNIAAGRLLADNRGLQLAADPTAVLPGRVTLPVDARIPYSVRTGDTLTLLAGRFGSTPAELVAGNAEVPGVLPAGLRVEVRLAADAAVDAGSGEAPDAPGEPVIVSAETLTGDSFGSLRARLAEQHPDVSLELVADALDRLGAALDPGPVLSCPLAVLGTGTSGDPVTGAAVREAYGCPPEEFAAANAALLGLLQPDIRLDLDGASTTTTEHDTVHAVLERLTSDGSRPTIDRLLAEHATLPLFRAGSRALLPPAAVTLTAGPGHALEPPALAVPLVVTLRMEGAGKPVEGGPADAVARADTQVSPSLDRDAFIDACLTALPTLRLATDAQGALWAVSFDSQGIAVVRTEPAAGGVTEPQAFALRPLYPALVDLKVAIRPVTARGELGPSVMRQYQGIDVEPWARSFLTDVDGYLAEPLCSRLPGPAREQLMECRRQLSHAVADGLAPLPSSQPGAHAATALSNARVALASVARTGLAPAYRASVLAQYRAVVVSPYGTDDRPSARLVATVQEAGRSDLEFSASRTELNPTNATCTFALTPAEPGAASSVRIDPHQVFGAIELDLAGRGSAALRFVRPLTGDYRVDGVAADLTAADLPVPLRAQPEPVSTQPMTAGATWAGAGQPTLAQATQWTADLTYRHQHAAQDVVRVSISGPVPAPATATGSSALAEALAGYLDAAARLEQLLGTEAEPAEGIDAASVRGNAAATLTALVVAVTAAWGAHRMNPVAATAGPGAPAISGRGSVQDRAGNAGFTGEYQLRAVYSDDGRLDRLAVSRTATEGNWPDIAVTVQDELLSLTPGPVLGNRRDYTAAGPLIAGPLAVRLEWPGLIGPPRAAARVSLTAERNAALRGAQPTGPEFILTAQPVQVAVPSPSLRWDEELPLAGTDLTQALREAFDVLAEGQPEHLSAFQVGYVELVDGLPNVRSALMGDLVLGPENAVRLADAMQDWLRRVQPATAGATWQLRLTTPSVRDGEPPLVTFERLVYPVSAD